MIFYPTISRFSNFFFQQYCSQVICISNSEVDARTFRAMADHKDNNKIKNKAIFKIWDENNLHTCSSYLKGHKSVAILDVKSIYGKSNSDLNLHFTV